MQRVGSLIRRLLDGFWFVPLATGIGLALLAVALLALDRAGGADGIGLGFGGDASAARDILSAVAGSLITVTGLTFSLTIVTLQLVSGQFTPRALRGLLADRVTQVVVGTFVGIVAYSLLVLRSVRDADADGGGFVPSLSTSVAIILALGALVLLVVFVHHIGRMIQVSSIAGRLGSQTLAAVERLYPEPFGDELAAAPGPVLAAWRSESAPAVAKPPRPGYVQAVLVDSLLDELASTEGESRVAIAVQPGDFVTEATPALEIWTPGDAEAAVRAAERALIVDDERDIRQDPAFGVRQLSDIALRAISPGINDPTTAVTCIGYLRAVLERLAARSFPPELRRDEERGVTLIARRHDFGDYLEFAVAEISRYATTDARVAGALLEALVPVAEAAGSVGAADRASAVVDLGRRVAAPAVEDARTEADREALRTGLARLEATAAAQAARP